MKYDINNIRFSIDESNPDDAKFILHIDSYKIVHIVHRPKDDEDFKLWVEEAFTGLLTKAIRSLNAF